MLPTPPACRRLPGWPACPAQQPHPAGTPLPWGRTGRAQMPSRSARVLQKSLRCSATLLLGAYVSTSWYARSASLRGAGHRCGERRALRERQRVACRPLAWGPERPQRCPAALLPGGQGSGAVGSAAPAAQQQRGRTSTSCSARTRRPGCSRRSRSPAAAPPRARTRRWPARSTPGGGGSGQWWCREEVGGWGLTAAGGPRLPLQRGRAACPAPCAASAPPLPAAAQARHQPSPGLDVGSSTPPAHPALLPCCPAAHPAVLLPSSTAAQQHCCPAALQPAIHPTAQPPSSPAAQRPAAL
jgi:hypothetical protein